ncbi:hypothetical protein [Streptomyces mirabilis]
MGYDMHLVRPPEGERAAHETASKAFDSAVSERDALALPPQHPEYRSAQEKVSRAYDAMQATYTSHFHLSTWGMSECRAIMDHFGMLSVAQPPGPPAPAASGASGEQDETRLAWAPAQPRGITLHKLGGDEGWIVTPGEIHAALAAYNANRTSNPAFLAELITEADWWPEWIDYLKRAAAHGGFRTYGPHAT